MINHTFYITLAYSITFLLLFLNIVWAYFERKKIKRKKEVFEMNEKSPLTPLLKRGEQVVLPLLLKRGKN